MILLIRIFDEILNPNLPIKSEENYKKEKIKTD